MNTIYCTEECTVCRDRDTSSSEQIGLTFISISDLTDKQTVFTPSQSGHVMFKVVLLLALAGSSLALNCAECVKEMHGLNFMIKQAAPEIMVSPIILSYQASTPKSEKAN